MTEPTPNPGPQDPPAGDPPTPDPAPGSQNPPPAADPPNDPATGKSDDVVRLEKALDSERTLRKDAEKRSKERDRLQARIDELEAAGKTESEKAISAAKKEAHAEAMATANRRLVTSEARAMAAEAKFRDPARVVRLLDGLDEVKVADDGTVDSDAIRKQLDELAKDADYLLEQPTETAKPTAPKPDPSQGPRGGKTTGTDVGREMFENRRGGKKTPAA